MRTLDTRRASRRPGASSPRRSFNTEHLEPRLLLATVSGLKFNDLDGDGVGEVGEPGLQGWVIYHDANNDNTLDVGEASDVTDATGHYSLTVPAGATAPTPEVIRELPKTDWRPTTPAGGAITLLLLNSQSRTLNFGNTQRGLVQGTKFNDVDGDGVKDAGEPGLANFTIFADLSNNGVLDLADPRDITDADGNYALNLATSARPYIIREVDQAGWRQTLPGPQEAPGTHSVTLDQPGETSSNVNFGNTQRVLLSGQKIEDLDADGVRDSGEPGLPSWRIFVDSNADGNFDLGEPSDLTDSSGRWTISPAGGGPFVVREVPQTGFRQTAPQTATNGNAHRVIFTAPAEGKAALGLDFLNTRRPLVSGIKFNDADADGVRDAGEAGLEGWTIYHDENNNLTLDAGEASTVTAADGSYALTLPPGTADVARLYRIREVDQSFWRQTFPVNNGANLVSLLPAQTIGSRNFGNTRRALVTGVKYEDQNGNGVRDTSDPGVGNVRIYADYNDNNIPDDDEDSVLTDANGNYSLDVVAPTLIIPGRATVIVREVLPGGWNSINPADGAQRLTIRAGDTATSRDFGNARFAGITGVKFHDLDADGGRDAGEPGLPNWRIYVDSNNNGVFDTDTDTVAATTGLPLATRQLDTVYSRLDASGLLPVITDVNVRVDITHSNVSDLSVFLISPRGTRVLLFSVEGGSSDNIDRVLLDDESANTFAATAPPYANETLKPEGNLAQFDGQDPNGQWVLEVSDFGGATVGTLDAWELILSTAEPSAVSATNGVYTIGRLKPGTHVVREVRQAGWFPTAPASATQTVTTRAGLDSTLVDFGNAQPGSVSGRKWEDRDGDGVIDAGEVGLAGWVIYRDLDDDAVLDTANRRFDLFTSLNLRDAIDAPGPGPGVIPGITQSVMTFSSPSGLIIDLNVAVNITHQRISDLTLMLTSPSGKSINLTGDLVAAGANMNTTFDDSAPNPVGAGTPPYTGVFRPSQPLTTFESDDPDGVWTLTIIDTALGPTGTARLNNWALDLTFGEPRRVTDVSGAYSFTDLRPGVDHVIREVRQPGWQQTFPAGDGAHRVRLASNQDLTGRNFGNRQGLPPAITAVYARGSSWVGDDGIAANVSFKEFLQGAGLGDVNFGYRINAGDILPWINVDQLVLRYDQPLPTSPFPGNIIIDGIRSDYTATPSMLDSQTVLLTLDRVLGVQPPPPAGPGGENGDRLHLSVPGAGPNGGVFSFSWGVLQGDVNKSGSVLADDFSDVKKKFFASATVPGPAGPAQYSVFHDVDGSGSILANDFSEVKKRFFDDLPAAAAVTASARRDRPSATADLFSGAPVLG